MIKYIKSAGGKMCKSCELQSYDDVDAQRTLRGILIGDRDLQGLGMSEDRIINANSTNIDQISGNGPYIALFWSTWGRSEIVVAQTLYLTVNATECSRLSLKVLELILCRAERVLASHCVSEVALLRRVSSRGRTGELSVRHGSPLEAARYEVLSRRH